MAELFGAIMRGLGFVLNAVYEVVPSYALAIIVLTIITRTLLIPLTIKQTRQMQAMQTVQPEMKAIQQKYKELQKKVKDRVELQQLRLKQNEEMQALFREHGASPLGGCLPMIAQMPVFICLFSVMRASLVFSAAPPAPVPPERFLSSDTRVADGDTAILGEISKHTICRPDRTALADSVTVSCTTALPQKSPTTSTFDLGDLQQVDRSGAVIVSDADWSLVASCRPVTDGKLTAFERFSCGSATGSGHLPQDGQLFRDVNGDRATILGMHPGCTPSQANSDFGIRQCTATKDEGGFPASLPYYILVIAIAGTQYISGKQMMARSKGQPAQQAQTMTRIMPIFFGFISLSFPAGLNFYYLIFNFWQMGQQWFIFRHMDQTSGQAPTPKKPGLGDRMRAKMDQQLKARAVQDEPPTVEPEPEAPSQKTHPRSKKGKKRKRR